MHPFVLAVASLLFGAISVFAQPPAEVEIERNIVYSKEGGVERMLDLARPTTGEGPFPLVVCLHGGAWQMGHRSIHRGTLRHLARHGYVAATVSYRLAPKHRWPAQIHDAKCAVRYLRSRAKELKIDPNRVAALGDSAGGHLALLLGLTEARDGLEGEGGYSAFSSKVQAVVNYYGPTDLRSWAPTPLGETMFRVATRGRGGNGILRDWLGTAERKDPVMAQVSPVTYLDAKDPPVLTLHGTNDPLVPLSQAQGLHEALRKAGIKERLEILEGQGHGWGGKEKERTDKVVVEFLDEYLKGKR